MNTILKYATLIAISPLAFAGMILWAFLLWNHMGADWRAFKFVFSRSSKNITYYQCKVVK